MAIDLGLRIMQLLDSIGIKGGSYLGKASNVKKAFTGGKATFFKPNALETLRAQDANFSDALKLIEDEAMFIANATDVEKMAFLNNLMEYKSLGGPKKTKSGITALDQAQNLTNEAGDLQTSVDDLMGVAKTMKEDAEKSLAKSKQDLDDWLTTGGQPFKKKDNKFLGGSMHEESQLRTGIRQFLQTEYKNGRLKLDELDVERIMQYSPMLEHDPIKVFKKIYGEEAYNKAGSFPGAFEKGENFKHYEQIFRENMGDEILTIKNNEYKGDGKLILTEQEEVFKPTPDDDEPFAEGGIAGIRQGYFKGKVVKKIKDALNPQNIKKAVDNIFKTGDYKYDAEIAAESFVELNPQLFGGKLYEDLDEVTRMEIYSAVLPEVRTPITSFAGEVENVKKVAPQMVERMELKAKYPGITDELLDNLINDTDPNHKAQVLATLDEIMTLGNTGKSSEEIVEIIKSTPRTKQASGGLAALLGEETPRNNYWMGGNAGKGFLELLKKLRIKSSGDDLKDFLSKRKFLNTIIGNTEKNKRAREFKMIEDAVEQARKEGGFKFKDIDVDKDIRPIFDQSKDRTLNATGGLAGYYTGGLVDVEPSLSDIGHGSDSLMARTRLISPNNQATTSTGLNYLLAEDNDNIRVPFSKGKGVDLARRGFLQLIAGTAGAVAALKSGALKLLGKSSPKTIPKIVEIGKGSGVPEWFEPMVNKVLADGIDVTKGNAVVDGQVVKRLDTPHGQVDVYHNERSGEIDVEYASESHAALGDSVHLNYKPGWSMADQGNPSPADEFLASENIPEGRVTGPDDYDIELGENTVDEIGGLYSDTSELEKLGGQDINMREVLKNIEKKKKLKKMQNEPSEFVTDVQGDYDPT